MVPKPNRGRWQAQGTDITKPKGGHSVTWEESQAPSKPDGLGTLNALTAKCEAGQRELRAKAWTKAQRYVARAPACGYPATGKSKSFYADPANLRFRNARVDLEITAGFAFADQVA
jgi:hypothetical protein